MIPYRDEKIENAICFISNEHIKKTRKLFYQTFLYKYLAFLDFISLEETGQPVLGLTYKAMKNGPVPIEIYGKRGSIQSRLFRLIGMPGNQYVIKPTGKPDLDYFSKYEIELMKRLIEIFGESFIDTKLMSDASHEVIRAWKEAYSKNPNSIIDYSHTYSGDIFKKPEKDLTYPEEIYLTYRALEGK